MEGLDLSDVELLLPDPKANYRPSATDDPKVQPMVSGNGAPTAEDLARARALRDTAKDIDVVFVSNIWGGREHNVRLFEQLAALECRTAAGGVSRQLGGCGDTAPGGAAPGSPRGRVAAYVLKQVAATGKDRP